MTHEMCSTCSTKPQIRKDGIIQTSPVAAMDRLKDEGGHHPRNRPPTLGATSVDFYHYPVTVWVYSTPQPNTEVPAHTVESTPPVMTTLIARFIMGPTWGPPGADRTQVGPILAPWTLLSGKAFPGGIPIDLSVVVYGRCLTQLMLMNMINSSPPWTKWPLRRRYFEMHIYEWIVLYFD